MLDELYQFQDMAPGMRVLLAVELGGSSDVIRFPLAWCIGGPPMHQLLHRARPLRHRLRRRRLPTACPWWNRVGDWRRTPQRTPAEGEQMSLLLPESDGVAACVERELPNAPVIRYGQADRDLLRDVTFYCLPYMGDAGSVALIHDMPRLAVVQSLSSGVDDVIGEVPATATLCNGHGLHHEEGTADLALTLILASMRQLPMFVEQQSRRTWRHVRTDTLDGKRVLLVGYGAIGEAIERRLVPFGAVVSRVSRTARNGVHPLADLPRLAVGADVLVICIALAPTTTGVVSNTVLAALPEGALVVNVARGPVVDATALTAQLTSGRLRAALDVTDVEPLPVSRPEWNLPNVIITPHIGGDTFAFAARTPGFVADQAARHLAGEPLRNVVRPPIA
jgi:phosphoglycerate dehydrogenase-like enzyme